jgi:inhibitor of cysteine peptidase
MIGCSTSLAGNHGTVELEGNPTTGYVWEYEIANPDIIKEVSNEYIPDDKGDGEVEAVGAGGVFVFTFKGVAQGETLVTFKYHRSWEEDTQPEETVTYVAVVDSNNVITLTQQ